MNRLGSKLSTTTVSALVALSLACGPCLVGCAGNQEAATQEEQATTEAEEASKEAEGTEEKAEKTEEKAIEAEKEAAEAKKDTKADEAEKAAEVDPARVKAVQEAVQGAVDEAPMTLHVAVIDLTDGLSVSVNGDSQVRSASMIKMLVAHTFLEQVAAGKYSLDDTYTLQGSDLVGGSGTLIGLGAGAEVTYRDILFKMIDVSDNSGTNILIRAVGMDAISATAKKLELKCTELNRFMMDTDAIAKGIDNYTCADDLAKLFQMVYKGTFVDKDCSEVMMTALRQQEDRCGIINGLPEGTVFAHKTGELDTVRHDGGIVEGDHPFVIVVLCDGEGFSIPGAEASMADVSRVVYDALTK